MYVYVVSVYIQHIYSRSIQLWRGAALINRGLSAPREREREREGEKKSFKASIDRRRPRSKFVRERKRKREVDG